MVAAEQSGVYEDLCGPEIAFDAAVLMKILPKFHGFCGKLEASLRNLLAWCIDSDSPEIDGIEQTIMEAGNSDDVVRVLSQLKYRYPETAERVQRMLWVLYTTGFAAFG